MNTHLLAYLAGAIDADGWITIANGPKNRATRTHVGVMGLGQLSRTVPDLLKETFGGTVDDTHSRPGTMSLNGITARRKLWRWRASDHAASKAAHDLLPFLRIKQGQAKLIIELAASKATSQRQPVKKEYKRAGQICHRYVQRMSPAVTKHREGLYFQCHALNHPSTN